jgi:hypothetical protein
MANRTIIYVIEWGVVHARDITFIIFIELQNFHSGGMVTQCKDEVQSYTNWPMEMKYRIFISGSDIQT